MEPGIYLTALVFGIGALHLVNQFASSIGKLLNSAERNQAWTDRSQPRRDDWYVFFHCSDLIGKTDRDRENDSTDNRRTKTVGEKRRGSRRLAARMPLS